MRSLLTLLLLLFTVPVLAQQSADLTWEPPTTFESGDPLPPGYLTGYRIYWSVEGGASGEVDVGVDAGDSRPWIWLPFRHRWPRKLRLLPKLTFIQ